MLIAAAAAGTVLALLTGLTSRPTLLGLTEPPTGAAIVLSVGDGDTLLLQEAGRQMTVRLACIDAPELAQAPEGEQARALLLKLAPPGTTLRLRTQTTDRYGRTVAELLRDGRNLNLQLVRRGQAFAYRQYLRRCDAAAYLGAERAAATDRLGVWARPGGLERPWEFRKLQRERQGATARGSRPGH